MSRFFAMRSSDVESEASSSDDGVMGGQMQNREQAQAAMLMYDSSSSEEEKRVVRSAKDKRYDALSATIKNIRNGVKIDDWVSTLKTFEQLNKQLDKAKTIIQKEGIPRMYISVLCFLDDRVAEALDDKEKKKRMSSANNRSLNTLRQKLRKHNKEYERFITEYRTAPDIHSEEEFEESSSEEATDEDKASDVESGSESESESYDEDIEGAITSATDDFEFSEASSESSESDIDLSHPAMSRAFWVKKTKGDEEEMTKAERRRLRQAPKGEKERKQPKLKMDIKGEKEIEYTSELIHQKLIEIQSMRGKRGADRHQAVKDLKLLSTKASTVPAIIKVKITLLSAMFDVNFNSGQHMQTAIWQHACTILDDILGTLADNPDVHLVEDDDIEETVFAGDEIDEPLPVIEEGTPVIEAGVLRTFAPRARHKRDDGQEYIAGCIYSFAIRLSDEYVSSLQNIDPHTQDYLDRLRHEPMLMLLLGKAQTYYEGIHKIQFVRLLAMTRVEFLYIKYDPMFDTQAPDARPERQDFMSLLMGEAILLHKLCAILYDGDVSRLKARGIICTAYHYAMHGHFHKARDLFQMSHVQDTILQADISTQILYNRALAMMAVCAFRLGYMQDALSLVADLYATGKIKELLAQGVSQRSWQQDRDSEQEKIERRRQVPYHMHISLDLLESVHLISAMILEVPNFAQHASDDKRHIISRNFRRLWDSFHKNAFNGPPENTRDYVVAASVALSDGAWAVAVEHLMQLKMWTLIPFPDAAQVALVVCIKHSALETFLLALGASYTSICGERLATRFGMSERDVHSIASRLMVSERLQGAWDATTKSIHMKAPMPNSIQLASLRFSDQIWILVDQNERSMEHRHQHGKGGVAGVKTGQDGLSWGQRQIQGARPIKVDGPVSRRW